MDLETLKRGKELLSKENELKAAIADLDDPSQIYSLVIREHQCIGSSPFIASAIKQIRADLDVQLSKVSAEFAAL